MDNFVIKNTNKNTGPLCREILYANIFNNVQKYLQERNGQPVFISGIPGTGKTYTINHLISYLKDKDIYKNVQIISLNCLELNHYDNILEVLIDKYREQYNIKDEVMNGKYDIHTNKIENNDIMTSSQMSLKDIMTSKVEDDSNESKCLIIFIDEMDSLISKNEYIMVDLCHIAYQSKIMIIGITNTLSLSNDLFLCENEKNQPVYINFPPYTFSETKSIIKNNISTMKTSETKIIFEDIGIDFITKKICVGGNGDIRNVMRICMKAYENALKNKESIITLKQVKSLVLSQIKENEDRELTHILHIPFKQQLILYCIYVILNKEIKNVTVGHKKKIHSDEIMMKSIYMKYKKIKSRISNEDYNGFRIGIENLKNMNLIAIKIKGKIEKVVLNVNEDILYHNLKKIEFFQTMM